jgi:Cd2+/Zn2+-exporting ATPase
MFQGNNEPCQHCAAERARRESVDFKTKYLIAVLSAVALGLGLLLEFYTFEPLVYYPFFVVSLLAAGRWTIPNGLRSIVELHLGISFLMTIASFGAVLINQPAEGAAVMFLFYIAEVLEEKAGARVRTEIESLVELEPPSVSVLINGVEACSHPEHVEIGQVIRVRPGEKIGLDGIIITGQTHVNQAAITGESLPVKKGVGDEVYAGTLNQEGYLEIEVTKVSSDTVLSRIITLVKEAQNNKSNTERFVARFSHIYTPIVVVGSLLLSIGALLAGLPVDAAVYRGLTLLVISCPCAFAISIPVSMVSALVGSARDGVLVKGAEYFEILKDIQIAVFDKTGTITLGTPSVSDICLHNSTTRDDILIAAASLEQKSEHPIAASILEAAGSLPQLQTDDFTSIPGKGVKAKSGGAQYIVGSLQLLSENDVDLSDMQGHSCGTGTQVLVARDGEHLGTLLLRDKIRDSTKGAIQSLKDMGIRTIMLTGDSQSTAEEVAARIGIEEFYAELLPDEKVAHILLEKTRGKVMMVGDGVNDAPALASSDIGIALGAVSSDLTLETSDVALMDQDLTRIPRLVRRAKRTMRVVHENVVFSIALKLSLGALALLGLVTLWMAIAIGDMGLTLTVILNALRLTRRS